MHILKSLRNRALGQNDDSHKISGNLVDEFQCHQTDEHPIIDDEEGITVPPLACDFCPVKGFNHLLALADENGCVIMYNTLKTGIQAAITEWLVHTNAVFDLTWLRTEQKLLTASGDQTAVLWDAITGEKIETFKGHTSSVKSVCMGHDNDFVFATGSRDGHIMVWDRRCMKKDQRIPPVNVIKNAHCIPPMSASKSRKKTKLGPALDSQQSVTNVIFQDSHHLISAGAVDGVIKVWDLRKNYTTITTDPLPKYSIFYSGFSSRKHGYSSLVFDSSHSKLFASCTDDVIYQYDVINYSQNPVHCYKGHQNSTFYVKASVSPDDQYIASGSSDQSAYIWKIGYPQESAVNLKGHAAEVTSVAWSPDDFRKIATLSDDNTMRIWRATKRMSIPGPVIGTAQRVSKDIGISASLSSPTSRKLSELTSVNTPRSQKITSGASTQNGFQSNPGSARKTLTQLAQTPPSIKKWFLKSQNKSEGNIENKPIVAKTNEIINRTPVCKRKLIHTETDSSTDSPSKRPCHSTLQDISTQQNVVPKENGKDPSVMADSNVKPPCEKILRGATDTSNLSESIKSQEELSEGDEQALLRTPKQKRQNDENSPRKSPKAQKNLCENRKDVYSKNVTDCGQLSYSIPDDVESSPVRKLARPNLSIMSSPTANLPNIVHGIGVVTPPKLSSDQNCVLRKGTNWLSKLQRRTDSHVPLLLSPKSLNPATQESEESDHMIPSPGKLKSPVPGSKSILSYFKRREYRL